MKGNQSTPVEERSERVAEHDSVLRGNGTKYFHGLCPFMVAVVINIIHQRVRLIECERFIPTSIRFVSLPA